MIETDLVCLVDKGETVSKCGSSGTTRRIGGVKREMEGKARIYIINKWKYSFALAIPSAVPATTPVQPTPTFFPFNSPPLRGISASTYTIESWIVIPLSRTPAAPLPKTMPPPTCSLSFSLV